VVNGLILGVTIEPVPTKVVTVMAVSPNAHEFGLNSKGVGVLMVGMANGAQYARTAPLERPEPHRCAPRACAARRLAGTRYWLVRTPWPRAALTLSTIVAALGLTVISLPLSLAELCVGLTLAGAGSSVQHPRGSLLVTNAYAPATRAALRVYNFSGDLGKAALPASAALVLPVLAGVRRSASWRRWGLRSLCGSLRLLPTPAVERRQ
jgi:hypothetical protein